MGGKHGFTEFADVLHVDFSKGVRIDDTKEQMTADVLSLDSRSNRISEAANENFSIWQTAGIDLSVAVHALRAKFQK